MKHTLSTALLFSLLFLPKSFAQTQLSVPIGEKLSIPLKVETTSPCNLEITVAGKVEQRTIEPSNANFSIEFETSEIGNFEVKWEGRFRSRGLKSVPACSSSGLVKITTTANTEKRKEEWSRLFTSLSSDQSACVKAGLRQRNILFESIDPLAKLDSPSSSASRDVFSKCDSFTARKTIWGTNKKEDFPCTLRGGEKSRCRGVYAEQMPDGKLRSISIDDAVKLHFDGRPWTTGQIELQSGKAEREQQARAEQERREKEELAKKEAEDRERKWKESPEYKRQQAELEKKRLAEERAAAEKAKKEREEADALARRQRAEEERRQKEQAERARQERENFAKEFPYYALVTCGFQGNHINSIACFGGRVGTEIELRNGNEYGLYKIHEIHSLGQESSRGLRIALRRNFELKAQNSNETLILGVAIIDVKTDKIVFQKQVSRFGVISVKN